MLTPTQLQILKADIAADPILSAYPNTADGNFEIAKAYNALATPDFIVWRTNVPESDFTDLTSPETTNWSWPAFIARSIQEQNGWARMFAAGFINPSRPNVRQGILDIFSGTQNPAQQQRAHCAAIAKRKATRVEKLFATGTGTLATPATMGFEGSLSFQDVEEARRS